MKQLEIDHPLLFSQVNWRNILRFVKTKQNIAYFLLFVVLSNHSVYMVFLDPHQGNDDFAFFLPTSKKFMWSSGRDKCENILVLHIL